MPKFYLALVFLCGLVGVVYAQSVEKAVLPDDEAVIAQQEMLESMAMLNDADYTIVDTNKENDDE